MQDLVRIDLTVEKYGGEFLVRGGQVQPLAPPADGERQRGPGRRRVGAD